jgi:molecular chaperone DnaJ
MAKNYYIILGIPADASQNQIKQAYRRRVKELHPDYYGKNSGPFREIQQAYTILKDPEQRSAYDRRQDSRENVNASPEIMVKKDTSKTSPIEPVENVRRPPVEEVFLSRSFDTYSPSISEILDRLRSNFFEEKRTKSEHIEPLSIEVTLSPQQAQKGGHVNVNIPVHLDCPSCAGHGRVGVFVCWRCSGHGILDTELPVQIPYPAGLLNRHVVEIPLDRFGIRNFYLSVHFRISNQNS